MRQETECESGEQIAASEGDRTCSRRTGKHSESAAFDGTDEGAEDPFPASFREEKVLKRQIDQGHSRGQFEEAGRGVEAIGQDKEEGGNGTDEIREGARNDQEQEQQYGLIAKLHETHAGGSPPDFGFRDFVEVDLFALEGAVENGLPGDAIARQLHDVYMIGNGDPRKRYGCGETFCGDGGEFIDELAAQVGFDRLAIGRR